MRKKKTEAQLEDKVYYWPDIREIEDTSLVTTKVNLRNIHEINKRLNTKFFLNFTDARVAFVKEFRSESNKYHTAINNVLKTNKTEVEVYNSSGDQ